MKVQIDNQFVVLVGNPIDGHTLYGPFETSGAAHDFMEFSKFMDPMWVTHLIHPEN